MENNYLIIRAAYGSIIVGIIIILAKIIGWYFTDSPTILASLMDSLLDISASFINFIAARYALQPPDNEHRFGHDKAEDLAVFTQALFFGLSGIFVVFVAAKRLVHPKLVEFEEFGIAIMCFSSIATTVLVLYQSYVFSKTKSSIVKTDRFHYSIDLITNATIIASLYLSAKFNSKILDPMFAMIIAIYILYGSWRLISKAFHNLMDHEFHESEKNKIHMILSANEQIKGYHDLKTRYAGRKPFIQFHIELDGEMPLKESHKILDKIEREIVEKFKDAEVIIHQDPEGIEEKKQFER